MGGSILSATTPAATEAKHIFLKYLATGSREEGLSPEAPVCIVPIPYHEVSIVFLSAGKKSLEDGRSNSH